MTQAQPAPPLSDEELVHLAKCDEHGTYERELCDRAADEIRRLRAPVEGASSLREAAELTGEIADEIENPGCHQGDIITRRGTYLFRANEMLCRLLAANAALSKTNTSQATTILGLEARVSGLEEDEKSLVGYGTAQRERAEAAELRATSAEALLKDPVGDEEVREVHIALDNIPMRSGTPAQADFSRLREDHVKAIEILTRLSTQLTEAKAEVERMKAMPCPGHVGTIGKQVP